MELLTLKTRKSRFNRAFVTVELEGELVINTADDFENVLTGLFQEGQYHIILNLKKLNYISSAGFGKIFKIIDVIRKNNGDLKITQASPGLHQTLELLDMPSLLRGLKTRKKVFQAF